MSNRIFDTILRTVFGEPTQCVYCGRDLPRGNACAVCANEEKSLLLAKFVGPALCCYRYDGVVRELIHAFKYGDSPYLGVYMAERMLRVLDDACLSFDAVDFVPVHPRRKAWRGFDQCEMLASHVAAGRGVPVLYALERTKNTKPMYDLNREEREENIRGAFCWKGKATPAKRVLLIDDILTTGASMHVCAAEFAAHGAEVIPFCYAYESL